MSEITKNMMLKNAMIKNFPRVQHVLITGASSGIGAGLARAFAAQAYHSGEKVHITLLARRLHLLENLADEIKQMGRQSQHPDSVITHILDADLGNIAQIPSVVDKIESAGGFIDVLVNNAGVQIVAPTHLTPWEDAEALLRVDTLAPMRLINLLLPKMVEKKHGFIVDIASLVAIAPTPYMYFYNAAKAALASASEALRSEVKVHNVHVITVYPGPVTTEMEQYGRGAFEQTSSVKNTPTGTVAGLATRILRALAQREARVIYPRVYALSRHFPAITRTVLDVMTPPVRSDLPYRASSTQESTSHDESVQRKSK